MPPESERYEEKGSYAGTAMERLRLIKTIVAMANTGGGQVRLRVVSGGKRALDSASLDSMVNRFVGPPLHGLESEDDGEGGVLITVPDSASKPHVMTEAGRYQEEGQQKHAFHRGQVWVRHSSSNAEAGAEDMQRITLDAAGRLLEKIGAQIRTPGFVLHEEHEGAQPVRLVEDPTAPLVRADPDMVLPLTRQQLCDEFEKPYAWISAAMKRLGIEGNRELSYADRNSAGHPTRWRYAAQVRDLIRERLQSNPDWDPIHEE